MPHDTSLNIQSAIQARLAEIEAENEMRIVYACESGSRAWGFPSADSDYDVRFIYVRPLEWYLSIDNKRDVVEYAINDRLDISGWDIKKALHLLRKTNPPLLEWIGSPIIYLDKFGVRGQLRQLAQDHYSPSVCLYHYLHMARGNFREYLQGDIVWVKKYFYVLRPIMAMRWIERGLGMAPTDFNVAVAGLQLDPELNLAISKLLESKRLGDELDRGERIPLLSNFIESELARWDNSEIPQHRRGPGTDKLDVFFRECIETVWRD